MTTTSTDEDFDIIDYVPQEHEAPPGDENVCPGFGDDE